MLDQLYTSSLSLFLSASSRPTLAQRSIYHPQLPLKPHISPKMPRQRGAASSAPRRPTAPAAPKPAPQQARSASTAAHPPAQQAAPAPAQQSAGSGLFGQMASTAA